MRTARKQQCSRVLRNTFGVSGFRPCTDPLYPCTALTLAEKSAALDGLTRLLHRLPLLLDEAEAVKAAICALRTPLDFLDGGQRYPRGLF